jgi:hypothetical protein
MLLACVGSGLQVGAEPPARTNPTWCGLNHLYDGPSLAVPTMHKLTRHARTSACRRSNRWVVTSLPVVILPGIHSIARHACVRFVWAALLLTQLSAWGQPQRMKFHLHCSARLCCTG